MLTSLDWLIIVFMGLMGATLLSVILMFVLKNKKAQAVCLYVTAALGLFLAYVGISIGSGMFLGQMTVGVLVGMASIASVVLGIVAQKTHNEKLFLIARIVAAAALTVGMANAFFF